MKVDRPGIYAMSMADYLADPCPEPSLSSHVAATILQRSARHAWWESARLNPAFTPKHSTEFDIGNVVHALLLEGRAAVDIIHEADFKKKSAQEARDAAYAAGRIPLLAGRWADVQAMEAAVRTQLAQHEDPPPPLTDGAPEVVLVWREGNLWCRARLDWLHADRRCCDDIKTTQNAHPDAFQRQIFTLGYDVQCAFHVRGIKAVFGVEAAFRFIPVETKPPYACAVVALDPAGLALAERRVAHAIEAWRYCLETNRWEGYPRRICWVSAPPWMETQQAEREYRAQEAPVVDDGRDVSEQLMERLR